MWEKNYGVIGNKYLKLYSKYTKLKKRKEKTNEQNKTKSRVSEQDC